MRVNTNMNALIAHNQSTKNTALAGNSMEKLSSGLRITKAGDDAAGLAISEKMRSQIRGLDQANRNVQDGVSMIQTAEGGMEEIGNILHRMRELTVQGANDTNTADERTKINAELTQLSEEITRIAETTQFNGQNLLDGSAGDGAGAVNIQVGANSGQTITLQFDAMDATTLAVDGLDVDDTTNANAATDAIDAALETVNTARATMGASQNRLEYTSNNLTTSSENLTAAESRIRDVDLAKEMVNLSKLNILTQASQSMISQANQQPQGVLQLLR
ncbi:MAG: flagellin [Peptostreptococcaceae bacterium]